MAGDLKFAGTRKAFMRGPSLAVVIPSEVAKSLEIRNGDDVAFLLDKEMGMALIVKAELGEVLFPRIKASLTFTIPEGLLDRMLREKERRESK